MFWLPTPNGITTQFCLALNSRFTGNLIKTFGWFFSWKCHKIKIMVYRFLLLHLPFFFGFVDFQNGYDLQIPIFNSGTGSVITSQIFVVFFCFHILIQLLGQLFFCLCFLTGKQILVSSGFAIVTGPLFATAKTLVVPGKHFDLDFQNIQNVDISFPFPFWIIYNAMWCQLFVALIVPLSDKCCKNVIDTVPATGMASDVFSTGKYINVFIVYFQGFP